jgi:hypothetical protein
MDSLSQITTKRSFIGSLGYDHPQGNVILRETITKHVKLFWRIETNPSSILKFGAVDDMKQDEVEYLKQICIPYMQVEHTSVDNHSIVLTGELRPHEVRLFELNLLFGER